MKSSVFTLFMPRVNKLKGIEIQNNNNFKKRIYILIIIGFCIFTGRNINRINEEINLYSYKPLKKTFFLVDDKYFVIQKNFEKLIKNFDKCKIKKPQCSKELNKKVFFSYGKYIFNNK